LSESLKGEDLKNVKIRFTGHSLGGALATIATADFVNNLKHNNTEISKENISLTTFGSPRVFSPDAAGWFNKILSNNVTRYWRGNDPVSAVTPGFLGFKHVGESHKLPSDFTSQLFYNPMNLLKGLLDEHKTETYVRNIDKLPEDHTSFWARQYQYVGSFFRKAVSFFSW
jgi:hypothetical protein